MQKAYPVFFMEGPWSRLMIMQIQRPDELFAKIPAAGSIRCDPLCKLLEREKVPIAMKNMTRAIRYLGLYLQANVPAQGEANNNSTQV